jgi:internalin A
MGRHRWTMCGGMLLGLLVHAVIGRADDASVAEAIEKLGGRLTLATDLPGTSVVGVDFRRAAITDAELKELKKLRNLQSLNLSGTRVTDAGLKTLKDLASLQSLDLVGTRVTDAGLKDLKDLKSLRVLLLDRTRVSDAGVKELKIARAELQIAR